jgi:hypothetical protein
MEKVLGYDVKEENMKLNGIKADMNANIKRIYWRYTSKYTGGRRLVKRLGSGQHPLLVILELIQGVHGLSSPTKRKDTT